MSLETAQLSLAMIVGLLCFGGLVAMPRPLMFTVVALGFLVWAMTA